MTWSNRAPKPVPVPTLLMVRASSRSRPTMSRLTMAAVLFQRQDGIVHVVAAAPKPPLLARKEDEQHRASRPLRCRASVRATSNTTASPEALSSAPWYIGPRLEGSELKEP